MSAPAIERAPYPIGREYATRQKILGARRKKRWNTMSESLRESLRRAFSCWRLVRMEHAGDRGPYEYSLSAIGLNRHRLGRESGGAPLSVRAYLFLCDLAAVCLVMGHEWLSIERSAAAELLACSPNTAARMLDELVYVGLVEREATYGGNARLDALAGRGCAQGFDWEQGACYRPSARLRALWEHYCELARRNAERPRTLAPELWAAAWDRARGSNLPPQNGEPTPIPDPDRRNDTEIPSTNTTTGEHSAPLAPEKVPGPLGRASQLGLVSSLSGITNQSSEVRNTGSPNGHSTRCTCSECSAELEEALRKEWGES